MELKEYLKIIQKRLTLFISIIVVVVMVTIGYFYFRPSFYNVSLTLNITRQGSQNTDQFKYDDFYRLQADEKFAETVVQWLRDPRIASDIISGAGIDAGGKNISDLKKSLRAEKLSSQVVNISFSSPDNKSAEKMSTSIVSVISKTTEGLNSDQKEDTWFRISAQKPVITFYRPDYILIFLAALCSGIFLAFWIILASHYLE